MDLRKREKYQYKFLKSVLAGEYDKLRGYFLKYVEYSNNPVLADGFSKINSMVQTGGAISEDVRNEILLGIRRTLAKMYDEKIADKLYQRFKSTDEYINKFKNNEVDVDMFISMLIDKLMSAESAILKDLEQIKMDKRVADIVKNEVKTETQILPSYTPASPALEPGEERLANEIKARVQSIIYEEGESTEKNKFMEELKETRFASVTNDHGSIIKFINDIFDLAQNKKLDDTILSSIHNLKEEFIPDYKISRELLVSPALKPGTGPYTGFDTRSELSDEEGYEGYKPSTARAFAHGARPDWLKESKPELSDKDANKKFEECLYKLLNDAYGDVHIAKNFVDQVKDNKSSLHYKVDVYLNTFFSEKIQGMPKSDQAIFSLETAVEMFNEMQEDNKLDKGKIDKLKDDVKKCIKILKPEIVKPVSKLISKPVPKPVPVPESESESVVSMGGNDIPYNSFPLMTLEYFKLNKQYLPNKLK